MGIFKRMKTITAAQMNIALDGLEDPIAMLNQYIREMENDLLNGQEALARQIFLENKQKTLILETEAFVSKRIGQAKLAVERGEDPIAKLAIQEKLVHEKQLVLYNEQLKAIHLQTESLKNKLSEMQNKYDEFQHKRILLISRANVARSIKQIQQTTVAFNSESVANGMARAEDRILMLEAEVQASESYNQNRNFLSNNLSINNEELEEELKNLKEAVKVTA